MDTRDQECFELYRKAIDAKRTHDAAVEQLLDYMPECWTADDIREMIEHSAAETPDNDESSVNAFIYNLPYLN
jgi:hypothetical protein